MIVDHDVHVHTVLSACCHDELATPVNILSQAAEVGLKTIGFTDHMWDRAVPGASAWYRPQDLPHILQTRGEIPADTAGVRVLVGCESEYCGDGKVGISPSAAEQLDFVLLPMSHFHMKGFVVPPELRDPCEVARLLVQRFNEVVRIPLATGIAHPFVPMGYGDHTDSIISCISDGELRDSFSLAAEAGMSIEVTTAMFPGISGDEREGFHDETFVRVLGLAKQAGCYFHFAGDSHKLENVGTVLKLETYVKAIGITREHVLPLFRCAENDS